MQGDEGLVNKYIFLFLMGESMSQSDTQTQSKPQEVDELELEELSIVEGGIPVEATITGIYKDRCGNLVPLNRIRNDRIRERWMQVKDRVCVQLEIEVSGMRYLLFPMVVSNNPRSTFYRLVKQYGEKESGVRKLKKGSKIKVVFTERGFPRPYVE